MQKTILRSSLAIVLFSLLLASCKSGGRSGEAYTLKMRLQNGDRFSNNVDMKMKMNTEAMGQKIDMSMDMACGADFLVAAASGSNKNLTMEYTEMKMGVDMKMAGKSNTMPTNDIGDRLVGKKVSLTLNDKNEIIDSKGLDDLVYGDSTDMAVRKQMEQLYSKDQMNSMFGLMFQLYPDKPVRVGDTWEKETEVTVSNMKMKMMMKYKLLSVKDSVASIDVDGKIKGTGTMNQGGMDIEMDLKGGQKGVMNMGVADGYVRDGKYTMDISGDMKVMNMKVPLKMTADYTVKGAK